MITIAFYVKIQISFCDFINPWSGQDYSIEFSLGIHIRKNIQLLEKVQRMATKLTQGFSKVGYKEIATLETTILREIV